MKTDLVMASHPRSGSTFVMDVLHNFANLRVYLEIFHQGEDTIKMHLGDDWPRVRDALGLPEDGFRTGLVAHKARYLDVLRGLNPGKFLTYKIFPGHLPADGVVDVLQPAKALVVLRRNILESHISNEIATMIGRWGGVDTSSYQVEFDAARFLAFGRSVFRFLDQAIETANRLGVPVVELDYLDFAGSPDLLGVAREKLGAVVELGEAGGEPKVRPRKQDSRADLTAKVTNPDMLVRELDRLALADLLKPGMRMLPGEVAARMSAES